MPLYIGVDFHPHQQTVAWCDLTTGEIKTLDLVHNTPQVKLFYQQLPAPAVIGLEASSTAVWFEQLITELGHELRVGNPTLIRARARSRHKSDKRDAELLLDLLLKNEFPAVWRRSAQSNQVLEVMRLRLSLVKQRTQVYNHLQAIAHSRGLPKGKMKTAVFQNLLKSCEMNEASKLQREQLFNLLEQLDKQIAELDGWLQQQALANKSVQLLLTQKGVGYLTALAVVSTLGDVKRFTRVSKQVVAFVGLDEGGEIQCGKNQNGKYQSRRFSLVPLSAWASRLDLCSL